MEGLILGMDLNDEYCRLSGIRAVDLEPRDVRFAQADGRTIIQTALGKKKDVDEWLTGKEAYEAALTGEGFVVDKLLSRLVSGEELQIAETVYSAQELMARFIENLLDCARRELGEDTITRLTICIRKVDAASRDSLLSCMDRIGIGQDCVHVISRLEAFSYYVLSQKKEYWANESLLFDWSGNELHFYSLNVTRGIKPQQVKVTHQLLDEQFPSDKISEEPEQRLADTRLAAYAQKLLEKRFVSSVLLSGKGLEDCQNWSRKTFLQTVCSRRHVYQEPNVFARGAVVTAVDDTRKKTAFPYVFDCEGRIQATVMMEVRHKGVMKNLILANQGSCWYDIRSSVDLILDDMEQINIKVATSEGKLVRTFSIPLDTFPKRPPRTTRVQVILSFASENEAVVRISDQGFGELFPASRAVKKSKIVF